MARRTRSTATPDPESSEAIDAEVVPPEPDPLTLAMRAGRLIRRDADSGRSLLLVPGSGPYAGHLWVADEALAAIGAVES